jgi:hypothetical protein
MAEGLEVVVAEGLEEVVAEGLEVVAEEGRGWWLRREGGGVVRESLYYL